LTKLSGQFVSNLHIHVEDLSRLGHDVNPAAVNDDSTVLVEPDQFIGQLGRPDKIQIYTLIALSLTLPLDR